MSETGMYARMGADLSMVGPSVSRTGLSGNLGFTTPRYPSRQALVAVRRFQCCDQGVEGEPRLLQELHLLERRSECLRCGGHRRNRGVSGFLRSRARLLAGGPRILGGLAEPLVFLPEFLELFPIAVAYLPRLLPPPPELFRAS